MTPERWRQITGIFQDALPTRPGSVTRLSDVRVATTLRSGTRSTSY